MCTCVSMHGGVSPGWTFIWLSMLLYLVVFVFNEHLSDTVSKPEIIAGLSKWIACVCMFLRRVQLP